MKWVILPFILTCVLVVNGQEKRPEAKPHEKDSQSEKPPTPPTSGVSVVNQQTPTQQENRAADRPQGYFRRLFSAENLPNIGLFFVGVIGTVVAICTLIDIQKQTHNTRVIADAALLNAKAIIKSERPWITGSVGDDAFRLFGNPTLVPRFWMAIQNSGRTPGKLVRVLMKFEKRSSLDDLRGIEHDLFITDISPMPYVLIVPNSIPFKVALPIAGEKPLTPEEISAVRDGKLFLAVYGVIEYEDVFDIPDKAHKSGFFFYYAYGNPTSHGFQTYYSAPPDYLQVT
jgi:hypothetical protein